MTSSYPSPPLPFDFALANTLHSISLLYNRLLCNSSGHTLTYVTMLDGDADCACFLSVGVRQFNCLSDEHLCVSARMHVCVRACMRACVCACACVRVCVCAGGRAGGRVCGRAGVCAFTSAWACVFMFVCAVCMAVGVYGLGRYQKSLTSRHLERKWPNIWMVKREVLYQSIILGSLTILRFSGDAFSCVFGPVTL